MVNFECDLFLSTSSFYVLTIGPPRLITVGKNIIIFTACSENVSLVAERNLRARNPILRQQARSLQALLKLAKHIHIKCYVQFFFISVKDGRPEMIHLVSSAPS